MSRQKPSGPKIPPPTRIPRLLTLPMSWLYRLAVAHRNRGFDAGKRVTRLNCPVISIGNISTGGTGKTPMVHLVVEQLQRLGHHPVIAMRGYGAKPGQKGDEQQEHELAMPGVPVVAQPDRTAGLERYFHLAQGQQPDIPIADCVVLDDGFQHRRVARDLDIVLIDASRPPYCDALLPAGHLREPIASLNRADLVVLTHCEHVESGTANSIEGWLREVCPGVTVLRSEHQWEFFEVFERKENTWIESVRQLNQARGSKVHAVCGIGNSGSFLAKVHQSGLVVQSTRILKDHQPLEQRDIEAICQSSETPEIPLFLMTRKDWVKASGRVGWADGARVMVPRLRISLGEDLALFETRIRQVMNS